MCNKHVETLTNKLQNESKLLFIFCWEKVNVLALYVTKTETQVTIIIFCFVYVFAD